MKIPKYKNIFEKGYSPNCSKEFFIIKKLKDTASLTYIINYFGNFYGKKLQKAKQAELKIAKGNKKGTD